MTKFAERRKKWGQEMVFGSLSLPANIIKKLRLLRTLYTDTYGRSVSYGEIFERLFSSLGLGSVDPIVYSQFQKAMRQQTELDDVVLKKTKHNAANYDPAAPELEPWALKYFFVRDGEEVEASLGNYTPFFARIDNQNVGLQRMLDEGWKLINEVGAEISLEQASKISQLIKNAVDGKDKLK